MKSYKCIVSGKVQGVFYRKNVSRNALKENFKGYVKNLPNGDVEACVECKENEFNRFMEILHKGSSASQVDNIEVLETTESFNNFEIRY